MATYFDPRSWSPLRAVDPVRRMLDPSWLEQWAGFTTSWLDPFADLGAGTVTALLPDVLMTVLSDGIRNRFGGRTVSATVLGHEVTAVLETLDVRRRGAQFEISSDLTDMRWDRHAIESIRILAHGVRLTPGVPTKLRTRVIEITGTVTTAALIGWLNETGLDWELEIDPDGLIVAGDSGRHLRVVLDATVGDNVLALAVHRAYWRGIRVPRRYVKVAPIPLGELPRDARIVRADRDGDRVHWRLEIPELTGSFDLAEIRTAIVTGTTLVLF